MRYTELKDKIPSTDDNIYDLSWLMEGVAYSLSGDNPRRQGFEKNLRAFLEDRKLKIVKQD